MLGQLASSLAHELNQPLGAILRNAEAAELFLQSDAPDLGELRAIVADIRNDDQRASGVIDHLRALLKRREFEPRLVSVDELIAEVVMLTRADSVNRHVAIMLDVALDLPMVWGDRIHLQQVLLNLIINGMDALGATSDGERSLILRAHRVGGGLVEVAVSDNGPGIAAEKLARLFEPFFTTKSHGMGLGLPISRTIIEAHGGRLWAENNPKRGATFHFTLPVAIGGAA
jgi:C4-dicarboxylate-specific signal transduction histidine kinase